MSVPVEFVNDRGNKVEIKDTEARRLAGVAQTAAENAQSTANGANTLAQQAKDRADTAYTDAGTAQSTATAAGTLAQQAKDVADAASSAASANTENINILDGKVTALEGSVSDIEEDIETIKEDYISKEELQPYDILEDTDNLPLTFTTNGESLIDYKIYGNDNSNHIDEVTNNLPITIPNAKAGTVEDWTIEGNNIPQVENITEELPITFPSNGDDITDYTIYGNDNPSQPEPEGVLPLSFTTAETVLRDWEIDGNNNPNYVETTSALPMTFTVQTADNVNDWSISGNDNIGKNLLEITATSEETEYNGIKFAVDKENGIIIANGQATAQRIFVIGTITNNTSEPIDYYLSGGADGGAEASYFLIGTNGNVRLKKWDGTTDMSGSKSLSDEQQMQIPVGVTGTMRIYIRNGTVCENLVFKPMVRLSNASATFEPYQIGVGQRTANLFDEVYPDITGTVKYIPLYVGSGEFTLSTTAGRTDTNTTVLFLLAGNVSSGASSTSNGVANDQTQTVTAVDGYVTIGYRGYTYISPVNEHTMLNAGSTAATYVPYGYKIPLNVNSTTQNIYIGSTPLTAGQSVSKTSTGIDIATQVGTNTITTDLFNKPEMYVKALNYSGVGERTTNFIDLSVISSETRSGVTFTVDRLAGTVTVDGTNTSGSNINFRIENFVPPLPGNYYFTGCPSGGSNSTYCIIPYDVTESATLRKWDGTTSTGNDYGSDTKEVLISDTTVLRFTIRISAGYTANNLVFKPFLWSGDLGATTPFVPYGYQIPLAVQGKNLLEITAETQTINGVTFTVDKATGTITANGNPITTGQTILFVIGAIDFSAGNYILSGCPSGGGASTYRLDIRQEGGSSIYDNIIDAGIGKNFTLSEDITLYVYVRLWSSATFDNIVFKPMLRLANTNTNFVPYFHKDYTFYIGDTPLTEGESISKTSTGINIETQVGENTISTTLYNKPEMYCGMALGVGMPTKNLLEITAETQTVSNVKFTIDKQAGTVIADGIPSVTSAITCQLGAIDFTPGDYILSGCPAGGDASSYRLDLRINKNTLYANTVDNGSGASFQVTENTTLYVYARVYGAYGTFNEVLFKPMVRPVDTSATFEPYGYKVPITITDENSNTVERTFYIGSSRLLSGDTYTKTQAGIDIPTTSGNNIISTTLYNKPEMNVVCNSNVLGVGERTANLLDITQYSNSFKSGVILDANGNETSSQVGGYSTYLTDVKPSTEYTLVGRFSTGSTNVRIYYFANDVFISRSEAFTMTNTTSSKTFTTPINCNQITLQSGIVADRENAMVVEGNITPVEYIPYGYQLPITVTDSSNNSTPYTFQLGSQPLAQGQSISKTSTGTDIALLSGTNTISTTLGNKPEMRVKYDSSVLGVGERTKNMLEITRDSTTVNDVTLTVNKEAGTVTANGTATGTISFGLEIPTDTIYGDFYVSIGTTGGSSSTYYAYIYDSVTSDQCTQWDGITPSGNIVDGNSIEVKIVKGHRTRVFLQIARNYQCDNVVFKPMLRAADTDAKFIPYGYEIPIRIYDGEANAENTNYTDLNFYIGNSLLSADEYIDFINNKIYKYVSSVLTPTNPIVDLPVIPTNGTNTIDTTLYNKPTMYIKYSTDSFSRIFTTTLPTTFINHSDKVKDWIIYGNENGVGIETENLFEQSFRQGTTAHTDTTTSVCSLTVIPTEYGKTHTFQKYNDNFLYYVYGTNEEGKDLILSGGELSSSHRLFVEEHITVSSWTHENTTQDVTYYVIMVRKPNFPLTDPITYQDITPSDIPANLIMVTEGSTAPTSYIPYGYKVPLIVNGVEIPIYIGNSTLGANDTVSKTSTGIDIPTIDGENTINTTLTNKPTMKITKDFVTKEYIEDVANSCMNDNVEDIVENVVDDKVDKQMFFMFYSSINKNGMFRGKDLTNVYTVDEIYQKVSSGTFDDLYLGDYFTKSITTDIYTKFTGSAFVEGTTYYNRTGTLNNWVYAETEDASYDSSKTYYTKTTKTENVSLMIAHFNYYYNTGDTAFTNPHIILTNRNYGFATTSKMNPTNTTTGGYYNSEMHQTTLPCYAKSLDTALENHILTHRTILSNATNASTPSMAGAGLTGASSGWAWVDTKLQLMTEQQLYGSGVWTSSAYDVGCDGEKLAVFNFVNGVQNGRSGFWLRSVASSAYFALCTNRGFANFYNASSACYVRPLIVFG